MKGGSCWRCCNSHTQQTTSSTTLWPFLPCPPPPPRVSLREREANDLANTASVRPQQPQRGRPSKKQRERESKSVFKSSLFTLCLSLSPNSSSIPDTSQEREIISCLTSIDGFLSVSSLNPGIQIHSSQNCPRRNRLPKRFSSVPWRVSLVRGSFASIPFWPLLSHLHLFLHCRESSVRSRSSNDKTAEHQEQQT